MTVKTLAKYSEGKLLPVTPLPLGEGEIVEIAVSRPEPTHDKPSAESDEEISRRIRAAKTLEEAFEIFESAPDPDPDYDLCEAMNANRHPSERVLFPPELKGISW